MVQINEDCLLETETASIFQSSNYLGFICLKCSRFAMFMDLEEIRKWKLVPVTKKGMISKRKFVDHYDAYCGECAKGQG